MSDYCGTVYFFETLDSHGRTANWSVFYDVDAAMFVAERTHEDSDYVTGAATAADLQEALDGRIPTDVLARVAASATNERRAITVTFTEADGRASSALRATRTPSSCSPPTAGTGRTPTAHGRCRARATPRPGRCSSTPPHSGSATPVTT